MEGSSISENLALYVRRARLGDIRAFTTIVKKQCDRLIRRKKHKSFSLVNNELEDSKTPGPPELLERKQSILDIKEAIQKLSDSQKLAVNLY